LFVLFVLFVVCVSLGASIRPNQAQGLKVSLLQSPGHAVDLAWVLRDRRWLYRGAAIGLLVGLGRIMQGAHFLSDVVFGYPVVYLSALLLARPLLGRWRIE
jgi:hypothetical protein